MEDVPLRHLLELLRPDAQVSSVIAISLVELRRRGLRGVILDLDNTLVPWNANYVSAEVAEWVARLRAGGLDVHILSNASGTRRVARIAAALQAPFICQAAKPTQWAFRRAIRTMCLRAEQVAVVGDQVFTDVLGGNRLGAFTILVRPMSDRDFIATRVVRMVERCMLRYFERHPRRLRPAG